MTKRAKILTAGAAGVAAVAGIVGTTYLVSGSTSTTTVSDRKLERMQTKEQDFTPPPAQLPSGRSFYLTTSLPGPLTKTGAELRVLSKEAIDASPAATKAAITGLATGGLFRQDTHASCYLNSSGTARHCTIYVRSGVKPWAQVEYRVDTSGVHFLSMNYWS